MMDAVDKIMSKRPSTLMLQVKSKAQQHFSYENQFVGRPIQKEVMGRYDDMVWEKCMPLRPGLTLRERFTLFDDCRKTSFYAFKLDDRHKKVQAHAQTAWKCLMKSFGKEYNFILEEFDSCTSTFD